MSGPGFDPLSAFGEQIDLDLQEDVPLHNDDPAPQPSSEIVVESTAQSRAQDPLQAPAGRPAPPSYAQLHSAARGAGPESSNSHRAGPSSASSAQDPFRRTADTEDFENGTWMDDGAPLATQRAPHPIQIAVTDPVKRMEDSIIPGVKGGYYTYLVTTVTDQPGFSRRRMEVRRRFSDFVALADLLAVTHRGYFVFPRPDKSVVEGQIGKKDFVEQRRGALEKYLQKLATHAVVATSEELRVFLETEEALATCYRWTQLVPLKGSILEGISRLPKQLLGRDSTVPGPVEAAQSTKQSGDILRRFKEMTEKMKQDYREQPILSDAEVKLREERVVVEEFAERVAAASRTAERVVAAFEGLGATLGDLGMSLIKIAKYEDEEGSKCGQYTDSGAAARAISAEARRTGNAAVHVSRLNRLGLAQLVDTLDPLHDELAMSLAVSGALKEREAALLTVQCIEDDQAKKSRVISTLEEEGSQVLGGDRSKSRKVSNLKNDMAGLDAALTSARQEYDRVKDRNISELTRWREGRKAEFSALVRGFGQVNALYEERSVGYWKAITE